MAFYPETAEVNICRKNKTLISNFHCPIFHSQVNSINYLTLTEYQGSFSIEMNYGQL